MLNTISFVPDYTEILSAPAVIFQFLYVFTFLLHIIFVNLTLGGTFSILLCKYIYRNYNDSDYNTIDHDLSFINTYNISLTITTAIAPLLFIQILYDKFFYSSTIIIAFYWLSIIFAIIVAYYFNYIYKYKLFYLKYKTAGGTIFIIIVFILFLYTAFLLVSNTLLSVNPDIWKDHYKNVNFLSIPTIIPRFLHFVIASIALNGIFICIYSRIKKSFSENIKSKMFTLGKNMFIYATLLQFIVGFWFLFSHKKIIWLNIIHGYGLLLIILTFLSSLYIIYLFMKKASLLLITIFGIITLILMVILRRLTEIYYLEPYLKNLKFMSHYQISAFLMFLILCIIMLVLFAFLFKSIQKNRL
jgi:hypothetical protein